MRAVAVAVVLALAGAAAAQSWTVAVDWGGGPLVAAVQVAGRDAVDLFGVRVTPIAQVRAVLSREPTVALLAGAQLLAVPAEARWAMSGRVLWSVGWDGARWASAPQVGLVWTWRP